jgi:hypothetical protein
MLKGEWVVSPRNGPSKGVVYLATPKIVKGVIEVKAPKNGGKSPQDYKVPKGLGTPKGKKGVGLSGDNLPVVCGIHVGL